jgi:hypothetical protein
MNTLLSELIKERDKVKEILNNLEALIKLYENGRIFLKPLEDDTKLKEIEEKRKQPIDLTGK